MVPCFRDLFLDHVLEHFLCGGNHNEFVLIMEGHTGSNTFNANSVEIAAIGIKNQDPSIITNIHIALMIDRDCADGQRPELSGGIDHPNAVSPM
jgi:hypothetical protein